MLQTNYDVVIVGGGIVGLTLACALGSTPLSIAIIDNQPEQSILVTDQLSSRVSAINRASEIVLKNLGVWRHLPKQRIQAYNKMSVWEAEGPQIEFNCASLHESNLGWIIENAVLQQALLQEIVQYHTITRITASRVTELQNLTSHTLLKLNNGQEITTKLVVGADGTHSTIRQLTQLKTTYHNHQQSALVAVVTTDKPHQDTAYQCFLNSGPLALLPLVKPHTCAIVWSTGTQYAETLLAQPEAELMQQLSGYLMQQLGMVTTLRSRAIFPLNLHHAEDYVQVGIALIGDAAHTIHPFVGQGVNMGINDAAILTEVILAAIAKGRDIHSMATLQRYQRWSRSENVLLINAFEGLRHFFANDTASVVQLRQLGITAVNRFSSIKNPLIRRAMGTVGNLPVLAKTLYSVKT